MIKLNHLISVVIPAYNVEKYLPKCIESIINQSYKNLEIILVDDGSTDCSGKICDEYAKKDSRIVVIHRKNGGLSQARNDGISIAKGDFLTFVDSDDYVHQEYCEKLLNAMIKNSAEISACSIYEFEENDDVVDKKEEYEETLLDRNQAIENLLKIGGLYDPAWGKLYAKKLFTDIRFPVGKVYEDSATLYKLYDQINTMVVLNQKYYYYLKKRAGSIMSSSYNIKKQKDNFDAIHDSFLFLKNKYSDMKNLITAKFIRSALTLIERSYLQGDENLVNSEIVENLMIELQDLIKDVDKNVLCEILGNYKLACLFLLLQSRDLYASIIQKLYQTK